MTGLPPELAAVIAARAGQMRGGGRRDAALRQSAHYRARGHSSGVVADAEDALTYALTRMPATFAAVASVIAELQLRAPAFAPRSMLDAGAGPGTASWAAVTTYGEAEELTLLDSNPAFLELAGELGDAMGLAPQVRQADLLDAGRGGAKTSDLVMCAYALTELDDAAILRAAEALWSATVGVLVIVEPGRPRDYRRLLAVRARLLEAGARVLAPCPHQAACPLVGDDWCHFSVRLERSREHRQMKGGSLGYEDEKFSYLILAREGIGEPAKARVVKPPRESKFAVTLPLCGAEGLEDQVVASRDRVAFKAAKKLGWGDGV